MTSRFAFSAFVFDPGTASLTRNNREIRLPHQLSRVLAILVERAGALVTREELQQMIWSPDEYLDREKATNKAIYLLRAVLRDDPKSPKFIETIPKMGYRFRSEVTLLPPVPSRIVRESPRASAAELPTSKVVHVLEPSLPDAVTHEIELVLQHTGLEPYAQRALRQIASRFSGRQRWTFALGVSLSVFLVLHLVPLSNSKLVHGQHLSLGIAPLEVQGAGGRQLADSFRFELTDAMSELPEVDIQAGRSLATQQLTDASIPEVARKLHLDFLLLGKLNVRGKSCILRLELVRGKDATHLASFEYNGSEDELRTIRDKVQHDVFSSLDLTKDVAGANVGSTQNPLAYKSYLAARDAAALRTPESLHKALLQYQDAIGRDPDFAKAYAGKATVYLALSNQDASVPADTDLRLATESATKALELDPILAEPHAVLGNVALGRDWNLLLAEKELRRAIELDPHQAIYHVWLALVLTDVGSYDEGLAQINLARAEDPLWPMLYGDESFIALCAHDNARALAAAHKFVELAPDVPTAHSDLAWAFFLSGRYEDANAQWRSVASLEKDADWITLEDEGQKALHQGGVSAYAQTRLRAIERGIKADQENDFVPAEWYAYTGNRAKAMAALEDMVHRHDPGVIDLAANPMYDKLRHDTEFQGLLNQVGLTLSMPAPTTAMQASLR